MMTNGTYTQFTIYTPRQILQDEKKIVMFSLQRRNVDIQVEGNLRSIAWGADESLAINTKL